MNFRLLVVRPAGRVTLNVAHTSRHRATGLIDGLRPGATHLHDLSPVNETVSCEHAELGISVAPDGQRCSPFTNAVERENPMAARDSGAIDDTRHDWRQLA